MNVMSEMLKCHLGFIEGMAFSGQFVSLPVCKEISTR